MFMDGLHFCHGREMCTQFEALLRSVHPELSLHYWDWNLDTSNMLDEDGNVVNLFEPDFMGNTVGSVDEPLLSAAILFIFSFKLSFY